MKTIFHKPWHYYYYYYYYLISSQHFFNIRIDDFRAHYPACSGLRSISMAMGDQLSVKLSEGCDVPFLC